MLLLLLLPLSTFATTPDCADLLKARMQLAVAASNLQNIHTTHLPEGGGHYRPLSVSSCSPEGCQLLQNKKPVLKHEPQHPDADEEGNVAYPDINVMNETRTLNQSAQQLKQLALRQVCGSQLIPGPTFAVIHYQDAQVAEDKLQFNEKHTLIEWQREERNGQRMTWRTPGAH